MYAHLSGKFIVFEGVDGVGKSTQVTMLVEKLRESGLEVMALSTPSNAYRNDPEVRAYNERGESRLSATTLAVMAFADRMRTFDVEIRPRLDAGGVVILDRYTYSAKAYFTERGSNARVLSELVRSMPEPDYGFLLTLQSAERQSRIAGRGASEDWEEKDQNYLDRIEHSILESWPERYCAIKSSLSAAQVQSRVLAHLEQEPS